MTRKEAKELLPIIQAFAEGKVIECRIKPSTIKGADTPNDWTEMKEIEFWNNTEYRIKPEPTYRPFKDAEECWTEMKKHQPFGWLKFKDTESGYYMITLIAINVLVGMNDTPFSFERVFDDYTFVDGTPFGVKIET
nr:MAG TPA: hypothetical protein [Caudoviricetes sp.]